MPICPKCNNVIGYLIVIQNGTQTGKLRYNNEIHDCELVEAVFDKEYLFDRVLCPKCHAKIFDNLAEAEDFLQDSDELADLFYENGDNKKKN